MIKDKYFKRLLIPFLGLTIPMAARLVNYSQLSFPLVLFTAVYFIVVSQFIWYGAVRLQIKLRTRNCFRQNIAQKLSVILLINSFYGGLVAFIASGFCQFTVTRSLDQGSLITATAITVIAVVILTLVYESLFLSEEIAIDAKVMQQLDRDRQQAESSVLKNELDPHFLFNCLNALSYLVKAEPEKAYVFVHKLSSVFKYLLLNKQKNFVSLSEELAHLDDYYFLLQVRFDEGVQIRKSVNGEAAQILVLPCTLQTLVENAIKHNFFSEKEPLIICVEMNGDYVAVSNPVRSKTGNNDSTKTGLQNLKDRYRLVMNKNILVQKTTDRFLVKIPLAHKQEEVKVN